MMQNNPMQKMQKKKMQNEPIGLYQVYQGMMSLVSLYAVLYSHKLAKYRLFACMKSFILRGNPKVHHRMTNAPTKQDIVFVFYHFRLENNIYLSSIPFRFVY